MKIARRILSAILVLCLVFGLGACKTDDGEAKSKDATASKADSQGTANIPNDRTVALVLMPGGLGDKGWNDATWAGLQKMMKKYNIGGVTVETSTTADTELFVRELAEQRYGLIFCLDTSIFATAVDVAKDYPDTTFVFPGKMDLYANEGNDYYMWYQLNELGFMCGAVAAFVATDGNEIVDYAGQNPGCKIGAIFAVDGAGFYRYADAFEHGARWINPKCEIMYDFTAGFTDTVNCQTVAENMIRNGCDVIWTCCGTAGYGGLQACRLNNALGIGIDFDQDAVEEGYVITSGMRVMDNDVQLVVERWLDGTLRGSNDVFDVASGSLDITDMSTIAKHVTNKENFERLQSMVEEMKSKISKEEVRPYDTAESLYTGDGKIVRFSEWWEDNKDTNINNVHDWHYQDKIIYP